MSDAGQPAAPQAVDRKELLEQQFNSIEQAAPKPADVKVAPEKAAPAPGSDGRPRDDAGKFVKAEAAPRGEAGTLVQQAESAKPEPKAWDKAPASWKKEKHSLWDSMTPEQREYAFQREEQMRSGVEPLLPKAQLADAITRAAEPYMNTIRGLGMELPQAVEGLMKIDHQLRVLPYEQKLQLLQHVAGGYGIDLSGQLQQAQASPQNPMLAQLQNELVNIKGQFNSFTQAQEAAQQQSAMAEISKFAATAEHFDDVKPTMIQLLQGGLADNIQDAYEKAIRLSPDVFSQVQAAQQAAAEADKRKAADEAAKRAKAAAVSVKSATPGTQTKTSAQDRRSMLREQFDAVGSERL